MHNQHSTKENIRKIKLSDLEEEKMTKHLGLHETLDLHELLTFKNLCLTKATLMGPLAQDEELKAILTDDVDTGTQHIQQLQRFLTERRENG
jgi:similar to spore coat protein